MKKIQGFLIIFVLIILVGCRDTNIKPPNNIDENPNGVVDNEKSKSEEVMEEFTEMIQPETDAGDLGIYIRKNIEYVDKTDAEEMIRWLLVYQSEIKIEFIDKIYAPEYLKALNEDMEGVLDKEKVETISDTHIKDDYKKLINGFMTIIRYEEYPVVETDWKELNKFSSYVTEDFKEMLELYQKIQNYEYNREELDVVHLGEDIIKTEEILKRNKSNFVHTQANEIFNLQISSLLIGPEGSHLGFFIDKNTKEYENILELKELYPESFIGQIISDLDKKDFEEPMDIHEEISQRLQFGIDSQIYLERKSFEEGNRNYNILEIQIPNDTEKQNKTNNMIKKDLDEYENEIEENIELNLSIFSNYQDGKYLSYNIFIDYVNEKGDNDNLVLYRTYSYADEKFIDLEEYLGIEFDELKDYILLIKGIEIKKTPDFQISTNGIDLYIKELKGMEGYIQLSKKDLIPYLNLEELTVKY